MKAIVFYEPGGIDKLKYEENYAEPEIKENEVLVRVKTASLNHLDIWIRNGIPSYKSPMPHIGGCEGAGIVEEIGERVTIGHGAIIHSAIIGDRAVIGMGAVLSIRARVGENSIVAEGAVVKWNQVIPHDVVVGGNPARVIRPVADKDTELWAGAKQLYIDLAKKYLALGMELIPHGQDKEKGR